MIKISAEMKQEKAIGKGTQYGVLTNVKMDVDNCEQLAAEMASIITDLEKCNKHAFMMALDAFLRDKGFDDEE